MHVPIGLPLLACDRPEYELAFRTAVGDLAGNVHPWLDLRGRLRTCLLAGLHYDRPWTRDAAINAWNGLSVLWPAVAADTLRAVLVEDERGPRIGGQYWDAVIWIPAAWHHYLSTGDRDFLAEARAVAEGSLRFFLETEFDADDGLFRGGGCYLDGISAYPDRYRDAGDWESGIVGWSERHTERRHPAGAGFPGKALSTNCLYAEGFARTADMAAELGDDDCVWRERAGALRAAIRERFWNPDRGAFDFLLDPWGRSERQEGLGSAFAILFGVADEHQRERMFAEVHRTPQGIPSIWPDYRRYTRLGDGRYGRHGGTIWPQVNAFWAEACARHGRRDEAVAELDLLAARVVRDGHFAEVYHPEHGGRYGGEQEDAGRGAMRTWRSEPRQSWCATGLLRMLTRTFCGWHLDRAGLRLAPWLPAGMDRLALSGLRYRGREFAVEITRGADGAPQMACDDERVRVEGAR